MAGDDARVVMVTGASAGVGRAVAVAFGRRGARVGLLARGRAGLDGARRDVEAAGGQAEVLEADVADAEQVEAAARLERRFGPIDVWINNAMVSVFAPVYETTAAEYRRVIEVTYLGTVHGTLAALRRMRPRNRGVVVQVGSDRRAGSTVEVMQFLHEGRVAGETASGRLQTFARRPAVSCLHGAPA